MAAVNPHLKYAKTDRLNNRTPTMNQSKTEKRPTAIIALHSVTMTRGGKEVLQGKRLAKAFDLGDDIL